MHSRIIGFIVLGLSLGLPLPAEAGTLPELTPGMSQAEVVHIVGMPDAVRLECNGIVCPTHAALAQIFAQRTDMIVLKENRLVNYELSSLSNLCLSPDSFLFLDDNLDIYFARLFEHQ